MSIRNRIILLVTVSIIIVVSVTSATIYRTASKNAEELFVVQSKSQLLRINDIVATYLGSGQIIATSLATKQELLDAHTKLKDYSKTEVATPLILDQMEPEVRTVYTLLSNTKEMAPNVELVLFGTLQKGYIKGPAKDVGKGYDPTSRGWFKLAATGNSAFAITDPYVSTTGSLVATVSAPVRLQGNIIGVVGIDFNLQSLVDNLTKTQIGQTGHIVLFDKTGRVFVDPHSKKQDIATTTKTQRRSIAPALGRFLHWHFTRKIPYAVTAFSNCALYSSA